MNKKGITLIALSITILIMTILGVATVGSVIEILKLGRKNGYESTSRILREQVDVIYRETINKKEDDETFDETFRRLYVPNVFEYSNRLPNYIPTETITLIADRFAMTNVQLLEHFFYKVNNTETKKVLGIESTELNFYINFEKNIVFSMSPINIDDKDVYTLEEIDPNFSINDRRVEFSQVKIGDFVVYDPTNGVTDTSLLSYTSIIGSAKEGSNVSGNGHLEQTITATSNHNEYIVIDKENGRLKLMAFDVVKFPEVYFNSGQGFLYSEEELHKMCSVFGHGTGADKSNVTTYTIGNPIDPKEIKTKKLRDSGARSITIEDLQEMTTVDLSEDYNRSNPTSEVYYPTLYGELDNGRCKVIDKKSNFSKTYKSTTLAAFNLKPKYSEIEKPNIFRNSYFLANRVVDTRLTEADYILASVNSSNISGLTVNTGNTSALPYVPFISAHLRPIVFLSPDVKLKEIIQEGKWEVVQ